MSKLSFWRTISLVCIFCALEVVSSPAQTFTTLYSFSGGVDGYVPDGTLVQATDGNFYGVTGWGGAYCHDTGELGCGTIFSITPQGQLTTLHSFDNTDGASPSAGLVQAADGSFYGTTYFGGANSAGTVFNMTPGGTLTTLYSFGSVSNDGGFPQAPLVQASDGNFYGTASQGGLYGAGDAGTVFKITPDGTLTNLYNFCSPTNCANGNMPAAGLVQASDGNFYGTTSGGGNGGNYFLGGPRDNYCWGDCGTVFKITPDGELTTLYNFCSQIDCPDGEFPYAGLVQASDGNFYGTTTHGGTSANCFGIGGCGTVFKITPGGTLTTLYSFGSTDGALPEGNLVQATDGNFYGTTLMGGAGPCASGGGWLQGCGTVFEITPAGTLTTLHSFEGNDIDDCYPGGLIQATDGNFYGTTSGGEVDAGTVFRLGVGLSPFVKTSPTSGGAGTPVTITGNNLTGSTSVTFNGTAAAFTVVSDTAINTTVPSGATTGQLQVTTPSGTLTSNVNFQVM